MGRMSSLTFSKNEGRWFAEEKVNPDGLHHHIDLVFKNTKKRLFPHSIPAQTYPLMQIIFSQIEQPAKTADDLQGSVCSQQPAWQGVRMIVADAVPPRHTKMTNNVNEAS